LTEAARISKKVVTTIRIGGGGTIGGITSDLKALEPVKTAYLKKVGDAVLGSRWTPTAGAAEDQRRIAQRSAS
jgi:hypothetical protein